MQAFPLSVIFVSGDFKGIRTTGPVFLGDQGLATVLDNPEDMSLRIHQARRNILVITNM
jgi:hypothetical protein